MGINIRQKGADGERQVATSLNLVVVRALAACGLPAPPVPIIQRNQNQSAVGGGDLNNVFGLCVEVKRQEVLSVSTWWTQCTTAAKRNNEIPVLVYRQNNGAWRVMLPGNVDLYAPPGGNALHIKCRVEILWDDFLIWFYHWVRLKIEHGEIPRV